MPSPSIPPVSGTAPAADTATSWDLASVVQALRVSREEQHKIRYKGRIRELPSRKVMKQVLDGCLAALFPTHYGQAELDDHSIDFFVGQRLNDTLHLLQEQVRRGLHFSAHDSEVETDVQILQARAAQITAQFAQGLPQVRAVVVLSLIHI